MILREITKPGVMFVFAKDLEQSTNGNPVQVYLVLSINGRGGKTQPEIAPVWRRGGLVQGDVFKADFNSKVFLLTT